MTAINAAQYPTLMTSQPLYMVVALGAGNYVMNNASFSFNDDNSIIVMELELLLFRSGSADAGRMYRKLTVKCDTIAGGAVLVPPVVGSDQLPADIGKASVGFDLNTPASVSAYYVHPAGAGTYYLHGTVSLKMLEGAT